MRPVPNQAPDWLSPFLSEMRDAVMEIQVPTKPVPVWPVLSTGLPPAANWTNCVVRCTDLDILAASDGVNWIRQDTGAAI